MLQVSQLKKTFGDAVLFANVTFGVSSGERVALVGPNGAGKSTLLRMITGEITCDGGSIARTPGKTIAYLPQDARIEPGRTLHDEVLQVFAAVEANEERQRALEAEMQTLAADDPRLPRLIDEHAHLQSEFDRLGGHTIEAEIGAVLAGLGFSQRDYERPTAQFSGGWQMRIALAKLLLQQPDLLLLDEPTNHLDLNAVEWLEGYLRAARGAVVLVSHDRYFLNRATTRTLELEHGQLADYPGSYEWYTREKVRRREALQAAAERQQEYLAKQQAFIERFRAGTRSGQAKSREKQIARIEQIEVPRETATIRFRFPPCPRSGREVVHARELTHSYDGQAVFSGVTFLLERGDRLGLVGPNGAGKSTLLRLLAGRERAGAGLVILGQNVQRAYFAQDQTSALDPEMSVLDEIYRASPNGTTVEHVRTLLGRFLFRQDEVFKPIAKLSGGERSRVALAKLLFQPANLLLLDEPTNHLDIGSKEVLEDALVAFEGSVVIASHDRYLLDRVATKILEIDRGVARLYPGNYTAYRARKAAEAAGTAAPAPESVRTPVGAPRREAAAAPAKRTDGRSSEVVALDAEIAELEARIAVLEERLVVPEVEADREQANRLLDDYVALGGKLDSLRAKRSRVARR